MTVEQDNMVLKIHWQLL